MLRRLFSSGLACICLAVLLTSCGLTSIFSPQGTSTNSPVNISTNQAIYKSNASIQVSVTNNFQTPVYAFDTRASCSILDLSMQSGNTWSQSNAAPCEQKRDPNIIKIDSGQTYNTTISPGNGSFAPGNYRFVLNYGTTPDMMHSDNNRSRTVTISSTITVQK